MWLCLCSPWPTVCFLRAPASSSSCLPTYRSPPPTAAAVSKIGTSRVCCRFELSQIHPTGSLKRMNVFASLEGEGAQIWELFQTLSDLLTILPTLEQHTSILSIAAVPPSLLSKKTQLWPQITATDARTAPQCPNPTGGCPASLSVSLAHVFRLPPKAEHEMPE